MSDTPRLASEQLHRARERAIGFVKAAEIRDGEFALTRGGTPAMFPRTIAVFASRLLGCVDQLKATPTTLASRMRDDLRSYVRHRHVPDPFSDKPSMQALAFTLSALAALDRLEEDPLEDLVGVLLPVDVPSVLERIGALCGAPQSGNLAMCLAVVLIHARDNLGCDVNGALEAWTELHLRHMNPFGFWGGRGMTHLQFQNGYHQYEIFEYLDVDNPRRGAAKRSVASLADAAGHFGPYPGGGGCFDYDAVFVLTTGGSEPDASIRTLLEKTAHAVLSEQGADGGFCESRHVRPRTVANMGLFVRQLASAWARPSLFGERLRYALTLQRRKHNRIATHWSAEGRRWDESDLWDTWFRMLALARLDVALNSECHLEWGFLPFPGLGYHRARVPEMA